MQNSVDNISHKDEVKTKYPNIVKMTEDDLYNL